MLKPILLVEDNPHDLELTLVALERSQLANDVIVMRDGAEALDYLHRRGDHSGRADGNPAVLLLGGAAFGPRQWYTKAKPPEQHHVNALAATFLISYHSQYRVIHVQLQPAGGRGGAGPWPGRGPQHSLGRTCREAGQAGEHQRVRLAAKPEDFPHHELARRGFPRIELLPVPLRGGVQAQPVHTA